MRVRLSCLLFSGLALTAVVTGCSFGIESAVSEDLNVNETIDLVGDEDSQASNGTVGETTTTTSTSSLPSTPGEDVQDEDATSTISEPESESGTSESGTSESSATTESTTTVTTGKETTVATAPPTDSGDAEVGLQFDFGTVESWSGLGAEQVTIRFDRYQMDDGRYGPTLTTEVQLAGATDLIWRNENPKLRTYVVSPAVEALALDPTWLVEACSQVDQPEARYQTMNLEEFLSKYTFVGLTFDGNGQIIRFREQSSC